MTEHKTMRFPNLVLQFPFLTVHRVPYRNLLPETDKESEEGREEKAPFVERECGKLSVGNLVFCGFRIRRRNTQAVVLKRLSSVLVHFMI